MNGAALREGDRIVEVNGVNVEGDFHGEVASKIRSVTAHVQLLVVDAVADEYFRRRRLPLSSSQSYVERCAAGPLASPPGSIHRD